MPGEVARTVRAVFRAPRQIAESVVHAAAGGTGLLITQLAKARGARVIGTVSTGAKERTAREAGADEIIRYTEAPVAPTVRELTGGEGVAAVYDGVGRATFDASLESLRPRGVLAIAAASGCADLPRPHMPGPAMGATGTPAAFNAFSMRSLCAMGAMSSLPPPPPPSVCAATRPSC